MDLLELIKNRRTIRKYKDVKVSQEMIEKIIEAGRWAPSAHNMQPWKFVVIDNKGKIDDIVKILEKKAAELYSGFNIVMRDTAKNINNANVLLIIYASGIICKKFNRLGSPYDEIGKIYEIQSVSTAIENMLLCSYSLNLGMAWYGMPIFCEKDINKLLNQNGRLLAILSVGYPEKDESVSSSRKELSEITEFIR